MTDLSSVRDQVRERSDIVDFAQRAGFRRRGRAWLCGFHEDRTPSASVRNGRVHCFVCGATWDAIDLVRKLHGLDYVPALKFLAAELCIPWPDRDLTPQERAAYARRRRDAERRAKPLARAALWWLRARCAELEDAKRTAIQGDHIDVPVLAGASRELRRLKGLSALDVLSEYERFRHDHPEHFEGLVSVGRLWEAACQAACAAAMAKSGCASEVHSAAT